MLRSQRRKTIIILLLGVTILVIALTVFVSLRVLQNQAPDDAAAASLQVTNADRFKTQAELTEFARKWREFAANKSNDFEDYLAFATGDGARYECRTVIMDKVGQESLYGCDLNVAFFIQDFPNYSKGSAIGPQDPALNKVLDELITQSGILQKAGELKIITLDNTYFNTANKNYKTRLQNIETARAQIGDKFVKKIDFEILTIYFHNQVPPTSVSVEAAKAAAEKKMTLLYAKVNSGELTMEQAGELIKQDRIPGDDTGVALKDLTDLYQILAYRKVVGHKFEYDPFIDRDLSLEIKSLGEGQMSTVKLFKDRKFTPEEFEAAAKNDSFTAFPMVDSGYMIFKVNKIDLGLGGNFTGNSPAEVEGKIKEGYKQGSETKITSNQVAQ